MDETKKKRSYPWALSISIASAGIAAATCWISYLGIERQRVSLLLTERVNACVSEYNTSDAALNAAIAVAPHLDEVPTHPERMQARRAASEAFDTFNREARLEILGPQELAMAEEQLRSALGTVDAATWTPPATEEALRSAVWDADLVRNDFWDACVRAVGGYRDGPRPDPPPAPRRLPE